MECTEARVLKVLGPLTPDRGAFAVLLGAASKKFAIIVGVSEGEAIQRALQGESRGRRPMTHDLLKNVFEGFDIRVERVVISAFVEETYCATLVLVRQGEDGLREQVMLDARASDSIVLALRAGVPLEISNEVLEHAEDVSSWLAALGLDEALNQFEDDQGADEPGVDDDL